jgi:Flp pilus assembly pilin Flp
MQDLGNGLAVRLQNGWFRLRDRAEGQTMVEYGLILFGIALLVVGAVWLLKDALVGLFEKTASTVTNPPGG